MGKWKTTPFLIYDEMHSLVDGIIATGSGAFQAGAPPTQKPATRKEPSIGLDENTQSAECATPPHLPSELNMVRRISPPSTPPVNFYAGR
jgi:hypothetical protein